MINASLTASEEEKHNKDYLSNVVLWQLICGDYF